MKKDEEKDVVLSPDQGYGQRSSEDVVDVSWSQFPDGFDFELGNPVSVTDQESGKKVVAYIKDIRSEYVELDFNHPFAGETLFFNVKEMDVRDAEQEELVHGHVHHDETD